MSRRIPVYLIVAAAVCLFADARAAQALSLRVESDAVVVSEVTRGGSAVIFGVAYDVSGSVPTRMRTATIVRDDDGDGTVRYEPPQGVPRQGIWGAVDFATGAVQLGSRPGYRLMLLDEPLERSLQAQDGSARLDRFERAVAFAEILVVRPGQEAWTLTASEGGENDDDHFANDNLVVPVDHLIALSPGGKAPVRLQAGDVVLLIDTDNMRAAVTTLRGQNEGARQ
ncbi:MAG TPA: hypothetical protein VGR02_06110 [Thermoanaerobaculia bacterium]|jgi:hypothetical protein|nr:hypothetical protein [Thermoanaerobaculia bacterium]